eukprot:CAMPEP_0194169958 /NCGR_PEP_ID=MMETSP0154-20130528/4612_1 /TAXON_ID=1049557 /ORGANISM="Thalassiothrix antarctica, Strain L6-D1" /LENGTH=497 /DNA_ID=CAMNT_0038881583 /DNA_START=129 /DNA_END=1622 /DNA_ORIENTATION=-
MSSIPYDPSLILGQIVDVERLENLRLLAEKQKPLDLAFEMMNNVIMTRYKMKMIQTEMENLGVESYKMRSFNRELDKVEDKIAASAIKYAQVALKVAKDVELVRNQMQQTKVEMSCESPIDFTRSDVTQFPLSFDSLKFDVQYVRNEENKQGSKSHAAQISSMSSDSSSNWFGSKSLAKSESEHNMTTSQTQNHDIEGTVVITAKATHKNADIISPFVIDPIIAVQSWNYMYPDDAIQTDPTNIMLAALDDYKTKPSEKTSMEIISGCSKGSSFTGFVHVLQQESSSSDETAESFAEGIKSAQETDAWVSASSGGYGQSKSFAKSAQKMMSSSALTSHCSLICRGIIPSIVSNSVTTTIQQMDLDPAKIMDQLATIQDASNSGVNSSIESQSEEGKRGAQFMSLNSEYMTNAVTSIAEVENDNNKVIDTGSLMTAFEDFVDKAMNGDCGIPINFFLKRLTKNDIARAYIRKFYPSGVTSGKAAIRGGLGQEPAEEEE